jgi:hypothetical protein
MADNRYDYVRIIEALFADQLRYDWADLSDDEKARGGNAESVAEGWEYSGKFHELVDGLVPIYTVDIVRLWLDLGMPEAEDWGHEVSEMNMIQQMSVGIYYWTEGYARQNFEGWFDEVISAVTTK